MEEILTLLPFNKSDKLPMYKSILIKTSGGNYHVGQFNGKLFVTSYNTYLKTSIVITHYKVLE